MGPLLVVVDMQRVFAEPSSPWAVPDFSQLAAPIERLLGHFGDRVLFTRFLVPIQPEGAWQAYYRDWNFIREPGKAPLLELTAPCAGRGPVLDKTTFSAYGPRLRELAGPDQTIVLCGVSTECCVLATAVAAADNGLQVHVVRDACAAGSVAVHEAALLVLESGFAPMVRISTVDEEVAG